MTKSARIFFSDYGTFGWGVSSPDLPSLVGGASSRDEFSDDAVFDLARAAGLDDGGSVQIYAQMVFECDDQVVVVRACEDYFIGDRARHVVEVRNHVSSDPELRAYAPPSSLGDLVFVAALPGDSIRSVIESLEVGEPTTVAVERAGDLEYLPFVRHQGFGESQFLTERGLTQDSTVDALFATFDEDGTDLSKVDRDRELVVV